MKDVDNLDMTQFVVTTTPGASGLVREQGNFVSRAVAHLAKAQAASGLVRAQPLVFVPDPTVQTASSGAVAVHAQQYHEGIPLFRTDYTVLFGADGTLQESIGSTVEVGDTVVSAVPVGAVAAVGAAVAFLNRPENREPEPDPFGQVGDPAPELGPAPTATLSAFLDLPSMPTVLEPGPFDGRGVALHLVWVPVTGRLRLGWLMELHLPQAAGAVLLIVDATDASIIFATATTRGVLATATVYPLRGDQPKVPVTWPLSLDQYPVASRGPLPVGFPDPWITGEQTVGNSVTAIDATNAAPVDGTMTGGATLFDVPGDDVRQRVVNLFHYCCMLHDLYYLLGFREADGNFQVDDLGRGGLAGDATLATAYPGAVSATANMTTPKDGSSPRLNVGLLVATGRHTALDATVVFHEFSHGLTSRLVGGPLNALALLSPQSAGMSEGWSDYFACAIAGTTVIGAWVVDKPEGIRRHPYDDGDHPGSFADLGIPDFVDSHQTGEIWCSVLMAYDKGVGTTLAIQVVVDSLKLAPANPSFLDMRDAMARALDGMRDAGSLSAAEYTSAHTTLLAVFARFGMGPNASCDGAQLTGIRADFRAQATVDHTGTATPGLAIPDKDPVGVANQIDIDADGIVSRVSVSVDIAHEFRGDLQVTLTGPSGTRVVLRTPDDDARADLITTYDPTSTPGLATFVGQPVRGGWVLKVADLQRLSTGTLRSWSLTVAAG